MSEGTRPACWSIPSERIAMLLWTRAHEPKGWRLLWAKIAKAWERGA